jgi:membrane associated rhomboid family serine protease
MLPEKPLGPHAEEQPMSIHVEPRSEPAHRPQPSPPIQGSARWSAVLLLTVGSLLQVVEFLLEPSADTTAQRLAWWADHPTQISLSQAVGIVAIPFMIGGFWTMGRLVREHSRRTTAVAVSMLTGGMVGLAIVHGVELVANWLVQDGQVEAARVVLEGNDTGAATIAAMVLFMGGAMVGSLVLLVPLVRSPYVPRLAPALLALFMVLDFALGSGVAGHLAGFAGGVVLAWAVVVGYVRTSPSRRLQRGH